MVWKTNFEGENAKLIKLIGGIPIPTDSFRAMKKFNEACEEVLNEGGWLHVYPEGSMWFYYPDVRPFKKGTFWLACKLDKPVIPIALSFRERKGIFKLFGKTPCVDLHVGKPIVRDKSLPLTEATDKMHQEAYLVMQEMMGIHPGDPTYNTNQNIDEYKKTM